MRREGDLGKAGEAAAERYLRRRGYRILARRWRCPQGEIDLVAEKAGEVVFVEVKTRTSDSYGGPEAAVSSAKSGRLRAAAYRYLSSAGLDDEPFRIDVVTVMPRGEGRARLEHFVSAVEESD